ncbi:MAG TPA: hypothetical protein VMM76_05475 [Pirellulaceae bacterium]|nr:hypothetical protein [Pirellulaceae bacterium]
MREIGASYLYRAGFVLAAAIGAYFWGIRGMIVGVVAYVVFMVWRLLKSLREIQ